MLCKEAEKQVAGNVPLANTSPLLPRIPKLRPSQKKVRLILRGRARDKKKMRFGKPKRSALRQAEESPKPKKRVHWKLPPE